MRDLVTHPLSCRLLFPDPSLLASHSTFGTSPMDDAKPDPTTLQAPLPFAPLLMMAFWMLLGGAAGIKLSQSLWQLFSWGGGFVSVAVPIGGAVGAVGGAVLGRIRNPRLLVLLMAVFAGASAGGVAGQVAWGGIGEIGGQVVGGLVGGFAWAVWFSLGGVQNPPSDTRTIHGG